MDIDAILKGLVSKLTDEEILAIRKQNESPEALVFTTNGDNAQDIVSQSDDALSIDGSNNDETEKTSVDLSSDVTSEGDNDSTIGECETLSSTPTEDANVDVSHLIGSDLYWSNGHSKYKSSLIQGYFSIGHFEVDVTKYLDIHGKPIKWAMSPEEAISDLDQEVTANFHQLIGRFATNLYQVLADLYPYEVPGEVLTQVSTAFVYSNKALSSHFNTFRQMFPSAPFAQSCSLVDMLVQKLAHMFKNRSAQLKKKNFWPYRPHEHEIAARKRTDKPPGLTFDFNYRLYKEALMKRMVDQKKEKEEEKEKKRNQPKVAKKRKLTEDSRGE